MKPYTDEEQETVDAENNGNHNNSIEAGTDNSLLWNQLRTCPLEIIRSNPRQCNIYDKGFLSGFYRQNPLQSGAAVSEPRESAVDLMSANAGLKSLLEAVEADSLAFVSSMDTAIESALNTALNVAKISSELAYAVGRGISHKEP